LTYFYFIKISFKGTNYHGWQIQDNANTVQAELNKALSTVLNEKISCSGCGRTDTGVHASEFYAHFECKSAIDDKKAIIFKSNGCLPNDIAVHQLYEVSGKANARFDAISRTYQYHILRKKNPFKNDSAYYRFGDLDIDSMNNASKVLLDYEDFSCFSKSHTEVKTNNCTITRAGWDEKGDLLIFTITANRFLRGMARAIVGTLLEVGAGKMNIEQFKKVIEGKGRSEAGASVPASGLFLTKVEYPNGIFLS